MDRKDFWATPPGMLTGIAAILTALIGVYLAVRQDESSSPRSASEVASKSPGASRDAAVRTAAVSEWPLLADETFSEVGSPWPRGNYLEGPLEKFELSVTEGIYRWEILAEGALSKSFNAPFGFVKDFFASVEVVVRQHSVEPIDVGLTFGATEESDFRLLLKSDGSIGVSRAVGSTTNDLVVGWTPVDAPLDQKNRLAVSVDAGRMSFYVNDKEVATSRDDRYVGGSVGLSVGVYSPGAAVIEFDNFELRRRP